MQTKSPVYLAITKYTGSGANILPQRGGDGSQPFQQHGTDLSRQIKRAADHRALRQAESGVQRLAEVGAGVDRHLRQLPGRQFGQRFGAHGPGAVGRDGIDGAEAFAQRPQHLTSGLVGQDAQHGGPAGKDLYERLRTAETQEEANKIYKQRDSLEKSRRLYSPRMMALQDSLAAYRTEEKSWRVREGARKPSVSGLSFLRFELDDTDHPDSLKQALWAVYDSVYAGYLPGHPYHAVVNALRQSRTLAEGKPYPDYEITGNDGRPLRMSGLIRGKIALVDLWASWCGPCRANSKSMIPVYEEFKDKGFTVVGIAREKRWSDMDQAVRKDGYPWACYAEIEDANNVWALHGIGNSGGGTFLVDSDGTLLAVGASADEVREILRKKLGGKSGH